MPVVEREPRTGGISIAPASFMSALAAKAFAPAPEQKPVVPPSALPAIVEPAVVETSSFGEANQLDAYRAPEGATVLEVVETVYSADGDMEMIGGVACPVDPMERLQCESCQ
jgi:ribonucleoside-diphosphate reductase alpha chain